MLLVMPVLNGHEQTAEALSYLLRNTADLESLRILIWDNASDVAYEEKAFESFRSAGLSVKVMRSTLNLGYYRPILKAAEWLETDELVVLMHNDLLVLEKGWDQRVSAAFDDHPLLGILGFYGSNQVDLDGGGGNGQMYNFSDLGQPQAETQRITDLQPALILDSLFLATRMQCLPLLAVNEHTPLGHFVDRVWCLRLIEHGWCVGVLGVHVAHLGGITTNSLTGTTDDKRFLDEARQWCLQEDIAFDGLDPRITLFYESKRRYLTEFRDTKGLIPAHMDGWALMRGRLV